MSIFLSARWMVRCTRLEAHNKGQVKSSKHNDPFGLAHTCPVYLPPTTIASYYSGNLLAGSTVVFTGINSHDNDALNGGKTPYWKWDYDFHGTFQPDDSTTSPYASHLYPLAGTYTVACQYYDNDGQAGNIVTFQITIGGLKRLYYLKDHLACTPASPFGVVQYVPQWMLLARL